MVVGHYVVPAWVAVACAVAGALAIRYAGLQYSNRRGRRQAKSLEAEAASRGWECDVEERGLRTTWRFRGESEGIAWKLESVHIREPGDVSGYKAWTNWTATSRALRQDMVQLWPTEGRQFPSGIPFQPPESAYLPLLRPLLGEAEARNFPIQTLTAARPADAGSVKSYFHVLSSSAHTARSLLSPSSQSELLRYARWQSGEGEKQPGVPIRFIIAWDRGLTVLTRGATNNFDVLDRVVSLGTAMAKNLEKLK